MNSQKQVSYKGQQLQRLIIDAQQLPLASRELVGLLKQLMTSYESFSQSRRGEGASLDKRYLKHQVLIRQQEVILNNRENQNNATQISRFRPFFIFFSNRKTRYLAKKLGRVKEKGASILKKEPRSIQTRIAMDTLIFKIAEALLSLKQDHAGKNGSSLELLNQAWLIFYLDWHGLIVPVFLNRRQSRLVSNYFLKEERRMRKEGWSGLSLTVYLTLLSEEGQVLDDYASLLSCQKSFQKESRLIGSSLYEALFSALDGGSEEALKRKAQLPINQQGSYLDQNGMLQLSGPARLATQLAPDSYFLENYAETVKKAYPKGLLPANYGMTDPANNEYVMIKMIHQFRMYLDRQNLFYIRSNYHGKTDYDKLLTFEKVAIQRVGKRGQLDYSSNSNFHNRTSKERPFYGQHNTKIKSNNGLSEFIVRVADGSFTSQWDVLQTVDHQPVFIRKAGEVIGLRQQRVNSQPESYDLIGLAGKEVVDTESFNYSAKDNRQKRDFSHSHLDVEPANAKVGLEHNIKVLAKKYWKSQTTKAYGNNGKDLYVSRLTISEKKD